MKPLIPQTISIEPIHTFDEWRVIARELVRQDIPPENIHWQTDTQHNLFGDHFSLSNSDAENKKTFAISKHFVDIAKKVACYRCDDRWALMYQALWRLTHGEPYLLNIASDDIVRSLHKMTKEVQRDSHKMKAFVRFRKVPYTNEDSIDKKKNKNEYHKDNIEESGRSKDYYIAWHQPSHFTLRRTAPFFVRRFAAMNWAILTPDESAYWDGKALRFGGGVLRSEAPTEDSMETLWKTFYWNIFNPARIKVNMMKSEMPMKFWHTLPEAELIPDMLNTASRRVEQMIEQARDNLGNG